MHRRRFALAATIVVCSVIAGYGIAGAATGPGLVMAQGETDNVTCPNTLSVSSESVNALTLNCAPDATTTTTVDPTTTTEAPTTTVPVTSTTAAPTTTVAPTTTTVAPSGTIWQPPQNAELQWEIDHPLNLSSTADMGTGKTAYNGDTAPATNPTVYDIDGILNPASTVAGLHALGDHAICYIEVGTAATYYSAADEGIPQTYYAQLLAAGDLSTNSLQGYSAEKYVDFNKASVIPIEEAQIQQQCANKGFDSVETDLDTSFGDNDGTPKFSPADTLTQSGEEAYMTTLANYMHSLGLGWTAKNLDEAGIQSFVTDMQPLAQDIISEQGSQYGTESLLKPFLTAGKAVFDSEYSIATSKFCPSDNTAGINGTLFPVDLNGPRTPCR